MEQDKKPKEEFDDETEIVDQTEILGDETELISHKTASDETVILSVKKACLVAIDGIRRGEKFSIKVGLTKIGRSQTANDIVLKDDSMASARHATIITEGGRYMIADKRSRNRTFINGKMLKEDEKAVLNVGDEIEIGSSVFRFCEEGTEDISAPRKAGTFLIRNKYKIMRTVSLLILLIVGYFFYQSFLFISIAKQKPNPLQIQEIARKQVNLNIGQDDSFQFYRSSIAVTGSSKQQYCNIVFCNASGQIERLQGKGYASMTLLKRTDRYNPLSGVTAVDFDRDQTDDIAAINDNTQLEVFDVFQDVLIEKSDYLGPALLPPTFGDLDGDADPDIAVPSQHGNIYFGLSQNKKYLKYTTNDEFASCVVVGDIEGDGVNEVVGISRKGFVYIVDGRTATLKEPAIDLKDILATEPDIKPDFVENLASPSVGDNKIIVALRHGFIIAYDTKRKRAIWIRDLFREFEPWKQYWLKYASPILADFNNDGKLDVFIASLNGQIIALNGESGENLWVEFLENKDVVIATPAIADLNKDGVADIIFSTFPSGTLYVLNGKNGNKLSHLSLETPITSSPVIADIDGDNYLEIAVLNNNNEIVILRTNTKVRKNEIVSGTENLIASRTGAFITIPDNLTAHYITIAITSLVFLFVIIQNIVSENRRKQKRNVKI